jgi:ATP-dependent protease ClpP protease subunit
MGLKIVSNKNKYYNYEVYILGEISTPDNYVDLFQLLNSDHHPHSTIKCYLNSEGGDLATSMQLFPLLRNCSCPVTMVAAGQVHSAASLIFLGGRNFEVNMGSTMLCHAASSNWDGKAHELSQASEFFVRELRDLFTTIYAGFLTKSELEKLLDGRDYWFNASDITDRLKAMKKHYAKEGE